MPVRRSHLDACRVRTLADAVGPATTRQLLFEYIEGAHEKQPDVGEWCLSARENTYDEDSEMQAQSSFRYAHAADCTINVSVQRLEANLVAVGILSEPSTDGAIYSSFSHADGIRYSGGEADDLVDMDRVQRIMGNTHHIVPSQMYLTFEYHARMVAGHLARTGGGRAAAPLIPADHSLQQEPRTRAVRGGAECASEDADRRVAVRIVPPARLLRGAYFRRC
ncbi:hypothetical protein B0H21DRAFT_139850 [Amylocystis lapponica]|nr:hypothetical protein B0H21DRAFT_139850 [Amylocystis lapponica]